MLDSLMMAADFEDSGAYDVGGSGVFDGSASYLTITPGSGAAATDATLSAWVKRSVFGTQQTIFAAADTALFFDGSDRLCFADNGTTRAVSSAQYRDPSAWYHIVCVFDAGAAGSDKILLYVNGVELTAFDTDTRSSASANIDWGNTAEHRIGRGVTTITGYFNGYITEAAFVDGAALDADDFGEFDDNGVWRPVDPRSTVSAWGANGFYIRGEDMAAGTDSSGEGNDLTPSGVTQSTDSPTQNTATLLGLSYNRTPTLAEGATEVTQSSASGAAGRPRHIATQRMTSGKWYWEAQGSSTYVQMGIYLDGLRYMVHTDASDGVGERAILSQASAQSVANQDDGSYTALGITGPDLTGIVRFAFDADAGSLWIGDATDWWTGDGSGDLTSSTGGDPAAGTGAWFSGIPAGAWGVGGGISASSRTRTITYFLEQSSWTYAAPSGFQALTAGAQPEPAIKKGSDHFATALYSGTGAAQSISGLDFPPDLVWLKDRDNTYNHALFDSVRGATELLEPSGSSAETAVAAALTAFNADGFSVGTSNQVNASGDAFTAFCWKAGGAAVSNTDGSITTQVSVNQTAGFAIVTWTGTGANATIGHGLSATPALVIIKNRDEGRDWNVYHHLNTDAPETDYLKLNGTDATADDNTRWNDTAPTSSVISLGSDLDVNGSGDAMVAYVFAEVEGYSKFGRYVGNGDSDGTFVWCGFEPALVIIKRTDGSDNWAMYDAARNPDNPVEIKFNANNTSADFTASNALDFLSNGFKLRSTSTERNGAGGEYVFIAFAKHPSGGENTTPTTGR